MWRGGPLLATLFLVVSGCFASGPPADQGQPAGGPDERGSAAIEGPWGGGWTQSRLPTPNLAGEPSVAVAEDGTAYVVAPAGGEGANRAWRQSPGANWTGLGLVADEHGTNDAHVVTRADGGVWVATLWLASHPAVGIDGPWCIAVSVSYDHGATWDTNPMGCGEANWNERPWMTASEGRTYLLHPCLNTAQICLSSSTDNGAWNWRMLALPPQSIISPPAYRAGTLAFLYAVPAPLASGLGYQGPILASSEDDGETWSHTALALERIDGRFLQFAWDEGAGVGAWSQLGADGSMNLRGVVWSEGQWGLPTTLAENGTSGMPWAAARGDGAAVAFLWADAGVHPHSVAEDQPWHVRVWTQTGDSISPGPVHAGPLCSAYGIPLCPAGRSALGDFFSMAIRPDGTHIIAIGNDQADPRGFNEVPIDIFTHEPVS